ncbi:hypothetical protein C5S32_12690 [ANME-1 cluster archaeon GoMg1]|nr:hypothetical protein [ANME-1 cluster archaeon GoMg1]
MEKQKAFRIYGKVRELESMIGVPGLKIEALDKDLIFDDRLGSVTTDIDGNFEIRYEKEDFQELFFDQRPDIYLRIKNPDGKLVSTTEDKVRYGANRTEEFVINLPKKLLKGGESMKEKIEDSRELRGRILRDKELLRHLSEKIAEILNGKVEIGEDEAYTFVPFVYEKPVFAPEIFAGPVRRVRKTEPPPWWWEGLPAPEILQHLEKHRVTEKPTPELAMSLGEQIIRNKKLLGELSEGVSSVLKEHGVAISEDVTYVFSPIVYKKPTFAHEMFMDVKPSMFASMVAADPTPQPAIASATALRASESASMRIVTPIDGIPAPELLYALDKLRF